MIASPGYTCSCAAGFDGDNCTVRFYLSEISKIFLTANFIVLLEYKSSSDLIHWSFCGFSFFILPIHKTLFCKNPWRYFLHYFPVALHQVSACDSGPCKNGGTCTPDESADGYSCTCRSPEFFGVNCSVSIALSNNIFVRY